MECELYLLILPNTARESHILTNSKHSLVSIGALCYAGYIFRFIIKISQR